MNKIFVKLIAFSAIILSMCHACVAGPDWNNFYGTGNRLWSTSTNWIGGTGPQSGDSPAIHGTYASSSNCPFFNDGMTTDYFILQLGLYGNGQLNVTGGEMNAIDIWVGGGGNLGKLYVSGGLINISSVLRVGATGSGTGELEISGGTIEVNNTTVGYESDTVGTINLTGGVLSTSVLSMNIGNLTSSRINITNGVLVLAGNQISQINTMVGDGWITAFGGSGRIAVDFDKTNANKTTVVALSDLSQAWNPTPGNGELVVFEDTNIEWSIGDGAVQHDIYLGIDMVSVGSADTSDSTGIYLGRFSGNSSDLSDLLLEDTIYYWRIDEVKADNSVTAGNVWSFETGMLPRDLCSDTWVATDGADRVLSGYDDVGGARDDKIVGIFYLAWHGVHLAEGEDKGPYNVSEILANHPISNPLNPWSDPYYAPGTEPFGPLYTQWWTEPEAGFFLATDRWVIRRNLSMLADAGVDVMIIDATNTTAHYMKQLLAICGVASDIRIRGGSTPQIALFTHAQSPQVTTYYYDNFYSQNLYSDLWFQWEGKPLMLGFPDGIDEDTPQISVSQEIRDFFTWKECWFDGSGYEAGEQKWTWGAKSPQDYSWDSSRYKAEEISVMAATHPLGGFGRSNVGGVMPSLNGNHLPVAGTQGDGLYFAEQFERAIDLDPEFTFISGWNGWTSSVVYHDGSWDCRFLGQTVPTDGYYFVDAYNLEFSSDLEPMKGGFTDNYYYHMVNYIRTLKGVRPPQTSSYAKTVVIDGDFSEWTDVLPEYRDTLGDTFHRNHDGWGNAGPYINTTGRNDFVDMKVARDGNYVYFYAKTRHEITDHTDANWMLLFIDSDQDNNTGWEGYDYLINSSVNSGTSTNLMSTSSGWNWTISNSNIAYSAVGNEIEIRIPRSDIGQGSNDDPVKLDFHWADNIQQTDDVIEFAVSGDSAPNRRFNYRYDTANSQIACQRLFNDGNGNNMDLDQDCDLDIDDLSLFATDWISTHDFVDYAELAQDWMNDYMPDSLEGVILLEDDFESGSLASNSWLVSGNANWAASTSDVYRGSYSAESGDVDDSQASILSFNVVVEADSILSFNYRVSSESNYDKLKFSIGSSVKFEIDGEQPWNRGVYTLTPGTYTLVWEYSKDTSVSSGFDCAWIDDVKLVTP